MKAPPIFRRISDYLDRYRSTVYAILAILTGVLLVLAQIYPSIAAFAYSPTLLAYLTLLIVMDIARVVATSRSEASLRIATDQDDSFGELLNVTSGCKNADLIEYAGATTLPLIRKLRTSRVKFRLLIKHPETVHGLQRQRTITTLDTLYNSILADYEGSFEIRCYKLPYTLRGRHLCGRFLELGWLTPDIARQTTYGHANPSVLVEMPDNRRESLRVFFERTFKDYWEHAETEDGQAVLERMQMST